MCNRFTLRTPAHVWARHFNLSAQTEWQLPLRYNVGPQTQIPVIRQVGSERELVMMQWGLVPAWSPEGKIESSDPALLNTPLPSDAERLYVSDDHMGNFFECVKTRKPPICDVEIGHRSASMCHLGVIAIRLGRALQWNPQAETFPNDAEATSMLAREMRKPYAYDEA